MVQVFEELYAQNHQQRGDPRKLVGLLLELSQLVNPPLHFAAGADALKRALRAAKARRAVAEQYADMTRSTDIQQSRPASTLSVL